jgi:TnpA family transposase
MDRTRQLEMATCWRRPVPENVLSRTLRALGRIERTLFTLQWLSDPALHL